LLALSSRHTPENPVISDP
jgi:hypothetical protein